MPLTKSQFREKCLKKLSSSGHIRKNYSTYLLNRSLLRELSAKKRKNILFYYPLQNEADIRKVLQKMRKKHNVFVPFMVGKSFKMVPFRLPLKKKKFGILEAGNTLRDIKKIDIAIVPVVGVDGNLQRIGFGKGMYDRFFEKLQKRPYTIFIQPELCYTKEKICDAYDVTGDMLLTPTKRIMNKAIKKRK
ncbi:5-formyltetrahydrofolate cyclo-ligase [Sulfurimonas paralvinellae]|uniref:5-formyltetrahydrofolate cyclo-ligase n=1 Tax=Sulfurimonas paralvinellae TaxID=317658 RepID=A0A7M1B8E9_9BACT|nr:5-formyltetrahydrofolate cyclo-ligase [Sulfurimonas paralvinellae]QOP46013.1 5-formyltetrahydrofolate cyclo-ligase [Sulfurimonas paralvinellae]